MTPRLPQPGGDEGNWGELLNDFLEVAHDSQGNLKVDATQRANHIGSQAISTVTGLQTALDAKAATAHGHAASDITSGVITPARLGTGTASATTALFGDGTFKTIAPGPIVTLTNTTVTVGPTSTLLVAAQSGRTSGLFQNNGSAAVRINANAAATTSNGVLVSVGQSYGVETTEAIYAIPASGSGTVVITVVCEGRV